MGIQTEEVPRKVHVNTASKEEKERFKKEQERYYWILSKKKSLRVVSTDESFFFFYDSLVRKVWIRKDERPVVRITGSHQESVLFGATSLEGKQQLFRQYNWFNANTFLDYLKQIHRKFPKCYLFLIRQNNTTNQKK